MKSWRFTVAPYLFERRERKDRAEGAEKKFQKQFFERRKVIERLALGFFCIFLRLLRNFRVLCVQKPCLQTF